VNNTTHDQTPCSLGLSATSQQYFSLRTNQPPATSQNQPTVLFSQNKPAPAISHQPTEQAQNCPWTARKRNTLIKILVLRNKLTKFTEVHINGKTSDFVIQLLKWC
jgi:hypothetical protein